MSERVLEGLARFLGELWGEAVRIEVQGAASAGARRHNLLFDALRGEQRVPLVATILPTRGIQVMPTEVEAACLRFAEDAGMPVPHLHGVCSGDDYVGGPFFLTSRIEGETIPRRVLRLVASRPGLGARLARQCGEALGRLHAADVEKVHPELPRPAGDPIEAALANVETLLGELLQPSPAFALAYRWLARERPAPPDRLALVHGDFRNGNLIVGEDGLRASLDWEVAHVGDPLEDLGWLCQRMWRFRNDTIEVGGFGTREDLRAGYEEAGGGFDAQRFHWWKTLGTLRWGLGLAGQARQHLDGTFRSIVMAASGRRVAELEYDALMLVRSAYA